ncbi:heavy-metal-associated domain-containing protein [Tenacibaculum maritimum]|uniref:heavy-metal-associated domain-containing protein n=1 Tax=Tenacibaculum maritimum TaxID=107401 RepID=UPI0012E47A85|nr:heavy metal-associated domain-containing protein [Tenacibaculum maritimum]CAA0201356.1 Cation transport ATPase family protein [Tenacibaculum maritimum]
MRIQKIIFGITLTSLLFISCKNETKKEENKKEDSKEVLVPNVQSLSLKISGMSCEIGCAKTIQSKLSKKEGITNAKVIFNDSIATVSYDANKVSKAEIMGFIEGIAGGEQYKTSEVTKTVKACKTDCKKTCCVSKEKKQHTCKADCKKECCAGKKVCSKDCEKPCCTSKEKKQHACKADCKKESCAGKKA